MNWAMNWISASSLDHIWRSPTFPMWLTLAAAGFFGLVVLITLLRAEKSVANGALTVITLLAIAVAVAATLRGFGPGERTASAETRTVAQVSAALPQLACIDDLAGDAVLNACEKALFGSAESAASAVAYAASQISRLTGSGDVAAADQTASSELLALRRAIERDRYGLMTYVLMARDHCTPSSCAAFRSLADNHQIVANMDERLYENLITRYASSWNAPPPAAAPGLVAALPTTSVPTGKPTNAEFPSAASTPPVNIMVPEPGNVPAGRSPPAAGPVQLAPVPAPRPPSATTAAASPAPAAAKKPPAPKRTPAAAAPVQIAPAPTASSTAPAATTE
jgi:hypothetical protein